MHIPSKITLLVLIISLAGCIFDSDEGEKENPDDNGDIDPIFNVIGYGYDVTGKYADPAQIKGSVFRSWELPGSYTVTQQINHSIFATESGTTIEEYQEQLAEAIAVSGRYKLFSGAVKANFSQERYSIRQMSFATVMGKINSYQTSIPANYARADLLRNYMTSQAKRDLADASIPPDEIFRMYGTHVLTGAVMGARLDFNVAMSSSDVTESRSVAVLAEAEYSSMFAKVNASAGFSSETERRNYEEHRSLKVNAIGGRSEYAQHILTKNEYDQWIDSIEGNEVFCDFTQGGLLPIWEFCENDERRADLESAFETWIADSQIETHDAPPEPRNCILDIQVRSSVGDSFHQNGLTYYGIMSDLNRGAGGATIVIYVAIGLDNTTGTFSPITGLRLVNGGSTSCKNYVPPGYSLINYDLNSGADGQFIYLCYTRSSSEGPPIRSLEVWNNRIGSKFSWRADSNAAYFDVHSINGPNPLDLNKGAGGDTIHLLYSTE